MTEISLHAIAARDASFWSESLRGVLERGEDFATAAPRLRDLDRPLSAPGPAWSDQAWTEALRTRHRSWAADEETLASIDALESGAACVVTGQQPGLLLGPAYTLSKAVGAIALARELQRRHGRRVVPVFWLASDDSDFDEARHAWLWARGAGPMRASIPSALAAPNATLAAVASPGLDRLERSALERAGYASARVDRVRARLHETSALVDRAARWLLGLLPKSGLVVVDPTHPRLRVLAHPLFASYARQHRECAAMVSERPGPIDAHAAASALFVGDGTRRRKLSAEELDRDLPEPERLSPSVILRPLWQDWALRPSAAVYGPGELAYHAQIAPLYEALGVDAAPPVLRPHVVALPERVPWPDADATRTAMLHGGAGAVSAIARALRPSSTSAALDRLRRARSEALDEVRTEFAELEPAVERLRARDRRNLEAFERAVDRQALREAGLAENLVEWIAPRGRGQDRFYASVSVAAMFGEAWPQWIEVVADAFVASVVAGDDPAWWLRWPGEL